MNTGAKAPARQAGKRSAYWRFVRELFRYRLLALLTFVFVILSGVSLSAGLLGAAPVMDAILGKKQNLQTLVLGLNGQLAESKLPFVSGLGVSDNIIAMLPTQPLDSLIWIMVGLCVVTIIGTVCNFMHAYLSLTIVNITVTRVRLRAFQHALRAPLWSLGGVGPSDTISRVINDSSQLSVGLNVLLSKAVLQVFKGIAALGVAFITEWRVTLAALTVAPLMYAIIRTLGKRIKRAANAALKSQAELYAAASESLNGLRVVKVHTTERVEAGRFHRVNKQMLRELNRVRTARALASPLTEMLSIFLLCALVVVAGRAVIYSGVQSTSLVLALGFLAVAGASLKPLTGIINDIQTTQPAAERLAAVLDAGVEPGHAPGLAAIARHRESVTFDNVSVTYPGSVVPAVDKVTLTVPFGQRWAFVGPNGSGKTTLLGLVPRLYEPSAGRVLIDNIAITDVSVRSLRSQIGVVTQETVLFTGSVAYNISYGTGRGRNEVIEAAKAARAHEFIMALPEGYDTVLGAGGSGLSGGQRQRLAIARAILRDPAILVLDEATSMVDATSEAAIAQAIDALAAARTTLIVAHRLSTVLSCDNIVVLEAGRVIDSGTHKQLMLRCELYQHLARSQFAPEKAPGND